MTEKSTCSSGALPVKTSPLPESDWDLTVRGASSLSILYDCALSLERAGYCGKMSPRLYPAITERTSPDLFLCSAVGTSPYQMTDGERRGSSPEHPVISVCAGEYLMLNIPEFPNFRGRSRSEGSVSSLSDILILGNIPPRYYLTVKCAEGILRRAERRSKTLPPVLKEALIRQSRSGCGAGSPEAAREPSSATT